MLSDLQQETCKYLCCTHRGGEHRKAISFYAGGKIHSDDDNDDEKAHRFVILDQTNPMFLLICWVLHFYSLQKWPMSDAWGEFEEKPLMHGASCVERKVEKGVSSWPLQLSIYPLKHSNRLLLTLILLLLLIKLFSPLKNLSTIFDLIISCWS